MLISGRSNAPLDYEKEPVKHTNAFPKVNALIIKFYKNIKARLITEKPRFKSMSI